MARDRNPQRPRGLLEPCAGKPARTVLRGPWRSNAPGLPDHRPGQSRFRPQPDPRWPRPVAASSVVTPGGDRGHIPGKTVHTPRWTTSLGCSWRYGLAGSVAADGSVSGREPPRRGPEMRLRFGWSSSRVLQLSERSAGCWLPRRRPIVSLWAASAWGRARRAPAQRRCKCEGDSGSALSTAARHVMPTKHSAVHRLCCSHPRRFQQRASRKARPLRG
jgi:hypothetical protein